MLTVELLFLASAAVSTGRLGEANQRRDAGQAVDPRRELHRPGRAAAQLHLHQRVQGFPSATLPNRSLFLT